VLVSNPVRSRTVRPSRWPGAGRLTAAVAYLLTLGLLRERFAAVPDLVWLVVLAVLLGSGGAMAARGLPPITACRQRIRRRLVGRAAILLGVAGLAAGVLAGSTRADRWSDGERSASALAFCVSLAVLPFGIALLHRTARETRYIGEAGGRSRTGATPEDEQRVR
jgi:hypothetical protein